MSQSACNKAYIAERDCINEETNKTVVVIVTNIPAIGVVDSGKIIFTGSSLTGEEKNRLWGVAGIISLGNGQKLKNVINKIARMKHTLNAGKGMVANNIASSLKLGETIIINHISYTRVGR